MPLNGSGQISIGGATVGQSINLELGRAATATSQMNETALRTLAGVASGAISLSNFYGKSNALAFGYSFVNSINSAGSSDTWQMLKATYGTGTITIQNSNWFGGTPPGFNQYLGFTFDAPSNGTGVMAGSFGAEGKNNDIWGVVYSTGTYSNIATNLGANIMPGAGCTNSNATQGYLIGAGTGSNGNGPGTNTCRKINLSTYANATISASALKTAGADGYIRAVYGCSSHSPTIGYHIGGTGLSTGFWGSIATSMTNSITGLTFATDTTATTTAFTVAGSSMSSVQDKTRVYNWALSTQGTATYTTNVGYKFTFATSTSATFSGNASMVVGSARQSISNRGCTNNIRGWMTSGQSSGAAFNNFSYLTFATETRVNNIVGIASGLYNNNSNRYYANFFGQHIHLQ